MSSLWNNASKTVYGLWKKIFNNLPYVFLIAMVAGLLFCANTYVNADPEALPEGFLHMDINDVAMDHFNSVMHTSGKAPYTENHITYPPLAAMFYYFFYSIMGQNTQDRITLSNTRDMRGIQSTFVPYCLYLIICCSLIACLIVKNVKVSSPKHYAILIGSFLSIGFLSVLDRGNNVLLVTLLLLYYVFYYKSENRFLSETALIALALATGIKLYPIVFGVLLIKKHRIAEGFRALLYIFLAIFLPFFYFEGIEGMKIWLQFYISGEKVIFLHPGALNFTSIIYNLETAYEMNIPDIITSAMTYLFIGGGLLFAITSKKMYKAMIFCVLAIVLFAGVTFEYFLFMTLLPLTCLFAKCDDVRDRIYAILLVLVNIPLVFVTPEWLEDTGIYLSDVVTSWLLLAIMVFYLVDGAIDFVGYIKEKRWKYLFTTEKQLAKRELPAWEEL
jgi:hypothetical protein